MTTLARYGPPKMEHLSERVLRLVEQALDELADPTIPTSVALGRAIRIARLRSDGDNLIWLTLEARTAGEQASRDRVIEEVQPYFADYDELRRRWRAYVEEYLAARTFRIGDEEKVPAFGIAEVEARIESAQEMVTAEGAQGDEHGALLEARLTAAQLREVLARVRFRLIDYLTRVEKQIIFDELATSIFEGHRRYVDGRLQEVAPDALEQLAAAYRRRAENDVEARSHALASCRRALKSVADVLYPPPDHPVTGSDGKERVLTDQHFLSRLMQYVFEASDSTDAELLRAQIAELGSKLDALNSLASKGVHNAVSEREVDHCVIQTYLTLGDLLRVHGAAGDDAG